MAKHESWRSLTSHDLGMDLGSIKRSIAGHVEYTQAKDEYTVDPQDFFQSVARALRDRMVDRWNRTQQHYYKTGARRVYYLSLEFLIGRLLRQALNNLGLAEKMQKALDSWSVDLESLLDREWDAGLGNGGLGRLAACFMESLATLGIPAMGYGIRYEYGIFRQTIEQGRQVEVPDNWLRYGCPWEIPRPEDLFPVRFYGHVESTRDRDGRLTFHWVGTQHVMAMAHDMLVPGYRNGVVNTLRLWAAKAAREFDFQNFNRGDYFEAVHEKNASENISRVLYPNDQVAPGQELRLKQEYFFVSATLQDAIRRHLKSYPDLSNLHEKAVFQLNDTHPALAIPEMMRLLLDDHNMDWDAAWQITQHAFAYTNHTVLPEALETWPTRLIQYLLPRHMQLIYEINQRFLDRVRERYPNDVNRLRRMSIIQEGADPKVRMANLAVVGSFSINGVSALHSQLIQQGIFRDFFDLFGERFNNKTNGVTPRRWMQVCNPRLSHLISATIGEAWKQDLENLRDLERAANDASFQQAWMDVKKVNKERLTRFLQQTMSISCDAESMFDIHVKRIHEYKRQLLNILHILWRAIRIKHGKPEAYGPRIAMFGGKAAPGYHMAKRIIQLIHAASRWIESDPVLCKQLRVVFIPNYNVSLAEMIIPAADLSEQISMAGTEASGTGNMKFALNGALTIGTLDGANIEIREAVGEENFFAFGLDRPGVEHLLRRGYQPQRFLDRIPGFGELLHWIQSPTFCDEPFDDIARHLLEAGDPYLTLADFQSYAQMQDEVSKQFSDPSCWSVKSILNVARCGRFSSDRTIKAYATEIWNVETGSQLPNQG